MNLTDGADSMRSATLLTVSITKWKCALEKEQGSFKWMELLGFVYCEDAVLQSMIESDG